MIIVAALAAGALGAVIRWVVSAAFARHRFPWAVLAVNVTGSALGGVLVGLAGDDAARIILLAGLCGGLTTFSTLSVETVQLVLEKKTGMAALSIGLNVVLGIGAAMAGWAIASTGVG